MNTTKTKLIIGTATIALAGLTPNLEVAILSLQSRTSISTPPALYLEGGENLLNGSDL